MDFDKIAFSTEIYEVKECWMQRRQDDTRFMFKELL